MPSIPTAPSVRLFLRNKFALQRGGGPTFVAAVRAQLAFARPGGIRLVAACSEWPMELSRDSSEVPPSQMHIWEMPGWSTLYDAMYASAESSWLAKHQSVVLREQQDLLIELRLGTGIPPRDLDGQPHVYLYQEVRMVSSHISILVQMAMLKMARFLEKQNVSWLFCASGVTGQPQELCMLWSASAVATLDAALAALRLQPEYQIFHTAVASLTQRYMYSTVIEGL